MKDITVRTPEQLGRFIRFTRLEKSLSQKALAVQLGVERKWVIHLEAGNRKAELGLVLKALDALGLQASLSNDGQSESSEDRRPTSSRLDEVFRQLQRPERK